MSDGLVDFVWLVELRCLQTVWGCLYISSVEHLTHCFLLMWIFALANSVMIEVEGFSFAGALLKFHIKNVRCCLHIDANLQKDERTSAWNKFHDSLFGSILATGMWGTLFISLVLTGFLLLSLISLRSDLCRKVGRGLEEIWYKWCDRDEPHMASLCHGKRSRLARLMGIIIYGKWDSFAGCDMWDRKKAWDLTGQ